MSKVRKIMRIRYWNEVFKNWNEKTFSLDSTACREIVRNRVEIERRRGRYKQWKEGVSGVGGGGKKKEFRIRQLLTARIQWRDVENREATSRECRVVLCSKHLRAVPWNGIVYRGTYNKARVIVVSKFRFKANSILSRFCGGKARASTGFPERKKE